LAQRYCNNGVGAIEVWNETNLTVEWGRNPLDPGDYVRYLRVAYPRIKQACPSMVVVSAAMTPTGGDGGATAVDDLQYLNGLYAAGVKSFSDAIGAHPSGYNVPALCNDLDPNCNRPGVTFTAPFVNRHHSWSFLSTMIEYRKVMVANGDGGKQIWATEFGWPVGTGGGNHPAGADNSATDVATWFPQAYQWAKQQGYVGVLFAFSLDYDRGETDAFRILGRPAFGALQGMPK
jgi:hypothetical protein